MSQDRSEQPGERTRQMRPLRRSRLTLDRNLVVTAVDDDFLHEYGYRREQLVDKNITHVLQRRVPSVEEHAIFENIVLEPLLARTLGVAPWVTRIYRGDDDQQVSVHVELRLSGTDGFFFTPMPVAVGQPQFPPGAEGELARMFLQEAIDNQRRDEVRRLSEQVDKLKALMELIIEKDERQVDMIATVVSTAITSILARLNSQDAAVGVKANPHLAFQEWNTYAGFREHILAHYHEQLKSVMADELGITTKTITRRMEHFGLEPVDDYWPPTKWPRKEPRRPRSVRLGPASLAAASLVAWQCGHHALSIVHMLHVEHALGRLL